MKSTTDALVEAQSALELAQDNLRDHGDNCFLHDQGEYNACFCGKDSLAEHLQSVVEMVDAALALARAEQTCQRCKGSGESTCLSGGGPDAYDIACQCPECGGTGEARAEKAEPVAERSAWFSLVMGAAAGIEDAGN